MHLSSVQVACAALLTLALGVAGFPEPTRDNENKTGWYPHQGQAHHVSKRSFFTLQCRGVYDASIFSRLDRICDDCYNLFREVEIYTLCSSKCFQTLYFKGCMETLFLHDEVEQIDQMIDYVGKR